MSMAWLCRECANGSVGVKDNKDNKDNKDKARTTKIQSNEATGRMNKKKEMRRRRKLSNREKNEKSMGGSRTALA